MKENEGREETEVWEDALLCMSGALDHSIDDAAAGTIESPSINLIK